MSISFQIRSCTNPECGLRYPLTDDNRFGERCPSCLGETRLVLTRDLIRENHQDITEQTVNQEALLDNVRSAWNVGAIFRTADGLGLKRLYLCGITPTPEAEALRKTALGADRTVAWQYRRDGVIQAKELKAQGAKLVAVELDQDSQPLSQTTVGRDQRNVLVFGNEVCGIDPGILKLCDQIVHIPMRGRKQSFNVEVAFAIAAYALRS